MATRPTTSRFDSTKQKGVVMDDGEADSSTKEGGDDVT